MNIFKLIGLFILAGGLGFSISVSAALPAPILALQKQGYEIVGDFAAPSGMKGYAAMYIGQPKTVYLTPDGRQTIIGTMMGSDGKTWNQKGLDKQFSEVVWRQLASTAWVADGRKTAKRVVYVFSDPNCPYCNRFWKDSRPWVERNKVQIRHIMVGIIQKDSYGKAAAILSAKNPSAALNQHEKSHASGGVKPLDKPAKAVKDKLDKNHRLMDSFGIFATPAIFYRDASGLVQRAQGAPSKAALMEIMGGKYG